MGNFGKLFKKGRAVLRVDLTFKSFDLMILSSRFWEEMDTWNPWVWRRWWEISGFSEFLREQTISSGLYKECCKLFWFVFWVFFAIFPVRVQIWPSVLKQMFILNICFFYFANCQFLTLRENIFLKRLTLWNYRFFESFLQF